MGLYDNFTKLTTEKGGLMYSIKSLRTVNPTCMVVVYCRREVVFEDLRNFCMAYSVILIEDFNLLFIQMNHNQTQFYKI